jgi:hypothetical protein
MKSRTCCEASRMICRLFYESARNAGDSATLALVALDGKRLVVGVVVKLNEGTIETVTPIENLQLDKPRALSAESFENFWRAFAERFHPPAAALLCDRATFRGLLHAQEKWNYLAAVARTQSFYYQLELTV